MEIAAIVASVVIDKTLLFFRPLTFSLSISGFLWRLEFLPTEWKFWDIHTTRPPRRWRKRWSPRRASQRGLFTGTIIYPVKFIIIFIVFWGFSYFLCCLFINLIDTKKNFYRTSYLYRLVLYSEAGVCFSGLPLVSLVCCTISICRNKVRISTISQWGGPGKFVDFCYFIQRLFIYDRTDQRGPIARLNAIITFFFDYLVSVVSSCVYFLFFLLLIYNYTKIRRNSHISFCRHCQTTTVHVSLS